MRSKADIIIGIDPDVNKSGVAIINGNEVETISISFPQLIEFLQATSQSAILSGKQPVAIVEASWLISTNWHVNHRDSKGTIARKGKDAGRCHEVGRKIVECARYYGLQVIEQLPLKKVWKGKDGKITHEEIVSFTHVKGRTNQEERDALLLAWNYAGLPIRLARPLK